MISSQDRDRISAAIQAVEEKTAGEIVCVLMHSSSAYSYAPVLWTSFIALLSPWLIIAFTHLSVVRVLTCQIIVFIVVGLMLSWPPLRLALVPRAVKRTRAHRAAMEQFFARGVNRATNRMGVMIFVSLAEHYAHVIADDGVAAKVEQRQWQAAVDSLTGQIGVGRIADGFIEAIDRCGSVLAQHAPPDGAAHVLPNRIYVL
jgi:putative membrane protein